MSDSDDHEAPGWEAINQALAPLYASQEPFHYGTVLPAFLGGKDPLQGISAYRRDEPVPHWHFVTFGFTELYEKESPYPETNGWGFELTFRLIRGGEEAPPSWALSFLQNFGRYVFSTGNAFEAGHYLNCNGPIALDCDTAMRAVLFMKDPELGEFECAHGKAEFLQIVGITEDEELAIQRWNSHGIADLLRKSSPLLCTDLARTSLLHDPGIAAQIDERSKLEGSQTASLYVPGMSFETDLKTESTPRSALLRFGARQTETIGLVLTARLLHGSPFTVVSKDAQLKFVRADCCGLTCEESSLRIALTDEAVAELSGKLQPKQMEFELSTFPGLRVSIHKSEIRDQDGNVTETIG